MKKIFFIFALLAPAISFAQQYSIDWYTIASGNGTSAGSVYQVNGTIGQSDASGTESGGNFTLTGGFWSLTAAVQNIGAPTLTITPFGNSVKVPWPYPSTGWTLQQNPDLITASWSARSGIANDGTNNFITIAPRVGTKFYRLILP